MIDGDGRRDQPSGCRTKTSISTTFPTIGDSNDDLSGPISSTTTDGRAGIKKPDKLGQTFFTSL